MFDRLRNGAARLMTRAALGITASYKPWDDFWYGTSPTMGGTLSGVRVNADSALKLSAWNAGKRLLRTSLGMLPWEVYERNSDGGRTRAEANPTRVLLHDAPNEYQTPFEFKEEVVDRLCDYGNAISEIVPGPRATAQLWPIHPEHLRVEWFDRKSSRQRVYDISSAHDGRARVLRDDQVWHARFMSRNGGLTGASPVSLASEGIGFALATQVGMARLMANGMVPAVVYSVEQQLNEKQAGDLRNLIKSQLAGTMNWGEPMVLGKGAQAKPAGITPKDAMAKELLDYSIADIARILGIPLVLLQADSKDSSRGGGTGLDQIKLMFAAFTVAPLATMLEESADRALIVQSKRFFSEFNMNALLKGDLLSRYQSYAIAVNANNPWLKRNDILRIENMNPDDGPDGERYMPPQNNVGTRNVPGVAEADAIRLIDELNAAVRTLAKAQGIDLPETRIANGHTNGHTKNEEAAA